MKPLVYLAGPYTHPDPVANTRAMILAATELHEAGLCTPFIPHLSMLWHLVTPKPVEFWYNLDLEYLSRCDALLRFPGVSTGADDEARFATETGIPVFFANETRALTAPSSTYDTFDRWAKEFDEKTTTVWLVKESARRLAAARQAAGG